MKISAIDIKKALAERHSDDVFCTEVLTGQATRGHLRFDALAIPRSWQNQSIIGYEIKVSRGDFLQDNKMHLYSRYCQEMYLVCPKGMIKKEEIPEGMGLMEYILEKKALRIKKRSPWNNIALDIDFLWRIIISHKRSDEYPFFSSKAEYAQAYIEDKANKKRIGYELGSIIAMELQELKRDKERQCYQVDYKLLWEDLANEAIRNGIITNSSYYSATQNAQMKSAFKREFPENVKKEISKAVQEMNYTARALERILTPPQSKKEYIFQKFNRDKPEEE